MADGLRPELKPNPAYRAQSPHWQFFLDSYECGWRLLDKAYIFKHEREDKVDYKNRLVRATPTGYARTVINSYKSLLSRAPISRKHTDSALTQFVDANADGMGTGLTQLIYERIFPINQACGTAWILVDMPNPETQPVSKADDEELGMEPYCVVYPPTDIINWRFDGFGRLQFVTVKLPIEPTANTLLPMGPKYELKYWDAEGWTLYDAKGKEKEKGTHGAGKVPFVVSYNERSIIDQFQGVSAINNIAYINRQVFNLWSLLQEFMYKQCLNILTLPESLLADVDEDTGKRTIEIGTANALPIGPGDHPGAYLQPPTDPAQFLIQTIEKDVQRIYDEAKLKGGTAAATPSEQSGISKAFDFHETNMLLAKKAQNLEDTERGIVDLYARHKGTEVEFETEYARTFDLRDATEEIDELTKFLAIPVPISETKRERLRRAMQSLFSDASEEVKAIIEKEINSVDMLGAAPKPTNGTQPGPAISGLANRLGFGRVGA